MPDLLLGQISTPGTQPPLTGAITLVLAAVVCWKFTSLLVRTTGQAMAAFQAGRHEATADDPTSDDAE